MDSKNITIILIGIIVVLGFGYFGTMNMWRGGVMMEDEHDHTEHEHDEDLIDKTQFQDNAVGPKITVDRILHKFGLIPQFGGTVETTFMIKNEGTETLEIGDITTSCSCTSASISSKEISAGEQAILTVVFDPNLHEEPIDVFKRTVFIPTNDVSNPEMEIAIEVDIDEGN